MITITGKIRKLPHTNLGDYKDTWDDISIPDHLKKLHDEIVKESVLKIDEISSKYDLVNHNTKELENYASKGKKGLVDYMMDVAKQTGNIYGVANLNNFDDDQLYGKLKEVIANATGPDGQQIGIKGATMIINKFFHSKDKSAKFKIFDYIKKGLESQDTNSVISGYLGSKLDVLNEDDRLSLAATHSSYIHQTSKGLVNPKASEVVQSLESEITNSVSSLRQKYETSKVKDFHYKDHLDKVA